MPRDKPSHHVMISPLVLETSSQPLHFTPKMLIGVFGAEPSLEHDLVIFEARFNRIWSKSCGIFGFLCIFSFLFCKLNIYF